MPLDLHVLSLSLAFILSQDQTLRCSNCFFILSRSESKYILFLYFRKLTVLFSCTTSCFTCKSYKDRFLFLCTPRTLSKNNTLSFFYPITEPVTGCKDKNKFLFEPNLFESFFLKRSLFSYQTHLFETNKKKNTPPEKSFLYLLAAGSPLESGCKSTEYLLSLQIFYDLFLKKKCKLLRNNYL